MASEEELQAQSPIVAALSRCTPGRLASPNLGFPTCTMGAEAVTRDLMRMGLLGGSDGPELFSHAFSCSFSPHGNSLSSPFSQMRKWKFREVK